MSSGNESISPISTTTATFQVDQSMEYEKQCRKKEVIWGVVAGIFGTLLAAGGIGLIVWAAQALHLSSPTTATGLKGVAGCILFSAFGISGGAVIAIAPIPLIYSARKGREKDRTAMLGKKDKN